MIEKSPENNTKKQIGEGYEKRVYEDPNNKDRVIAKFHEYIDETPNQIKAKYYLTKILHFLFPKNIPDMHWAGSEPNAYQVDKVEVDERHRDILKYADLADEAYRKKMIGEAVDMSRKNFELQDTVVSDEDVVELGEKIEKLGIRSLDKSALNFTKDNEGNVMYLDSLYAWKLKYDGSPFLFFNFGKLENAINSLPENNKKTATNFLQRLKELYEEERDKNIKA